jgi:outer membrane protein assembly factor BamE (lipoprotein component of BamABCDE complex)
MKTFGKIFFMFLLLNVNGCLIIPIPTSQEEPLSGQEVTKEDLSFIQIGETTKTEISDRLGTPTVFWEDKNIYAYNWTMLSGRFFWAVGGGYRGAAGVSNIDEDHILLIQFDPNDLVKRFELTIHSSFDSYGEHLTKWSEKGKN